MPVYNTHPIYTTLEPAAGPRALTTTVRTSDVNRVIDLGQNGQNGSFGYAQAVYIDAAGLPSNATFQLTNRQTGQVIKIRGQTQGYYQLLAGDAGLWDWIIVSGVGAAVNLIFTNVEVATAQWTTA